MKKQVISIVLNNFLNDSRVLKEAISLKDNNYDVKVVCLHEGELPEEEEVHGIHVDRVKLISRNWSKNKLIQLIKYFEFILRVVKKYKKADIFHCNDLSTLPIGYLTKKIFNKKIKIVYDAHEHETEVNGMSGVIKKIAKKVEYFFITCADSVITVSDSIAEDYKNMYKIEKPSLVFNTPYYQDIERKKYFHEKFDLNGDEIIFIYQGKLSKGRGVELLLDTFKELNDNKKVLVIMGFGTLVSFIKEYQLHTSNIFYHEAVPPIELINYTCCANFGISMIEDTCLSYRYCLPNKVFEYMMAEIPVIVSNLVEMKNFVQNNGVGVVAEKNSKVELKLAIEKTSELKFEHILENIKKVKRRYNWEEQEKNMIKLYKELS